MNKTDRIIVAILFCLLIGWSFYGRKFLSQPETSPPAEESTAAAPSPDAADNADADDDAMVPVSGDTPETPAADAEESIEYVAPEQAVTLTNSAVSLRFSSWGGGISHAELSGYRETIEADSGPVAFDFSKRPALSYSGLPGIAAGHDYAVSHLPNANGVQIRSRDSAGVSLSRVAMLTNHYVLVVNDTIKNTTAEPIALSEMQMNTGPMGHIQTKAKVRGISYLGVDTLSASDDRVTYWRKELSNLFGVKGGCSRAVPEGMPVTAWKVVEKPAQWVAVKNKFFVQWLMSSEEITKTRIMARRDAKSKSFTLVETAAAVAFSKKVLQPDEVLERTTRYYVGPKKHAELRQLGEKTGHVMLRAWRGFGWWRGACAGLIWLLNALNVVTRNYGVSIILLTILVKFVFWPLTHKGTESMKRMQKLQPQLKKLREKHKNDPKKLQEKQMLLYREHGVNPLAGCLPMIVQMPVFIALFTVLRSAVELRFAPFLWIPDLSEPEGLLTGVLPFPGSGLNILPLAMTGTMVLQQRLTPSAGDPQQQKMMQFMPLMMLFIFYNMPSALVLYWTVSQGLSILQLVMQKRKDKGATD